MITFILKYLVAGMVIAEYLVKASRRANDEHGQVMPPVFYDLVRLICVLLWAPLMIYILIGGKNE